MIFSKHAQKCISAHVHPSRPCYDWKHPGRHGRRRDEFQKNPPLSPSCKEDCPICQSVKQRCSIASHHVSCCREGGESESTPAMMVLRFLLPHFHAFDLSPRLCSHSPSPVPTSLLRLAVSLPRDLSRLSSQSPSLVPTSLLRLAVSLPRDLSPVSPPSPHLRCQRLSSDSLFLSLEISLPSLLLVPISGADVSPPTRCFSPSLFLSLAISLPSLLPVPISGADLSPSTRCFSPGADECAVPILPVVNECQSSILPPTKGINSPSTDATTTSVAVPCLVSSSTRLCSPAPTISITDVGESILPCRKLPPVCASARHL